ncbi:AAA ATPase domain-containing protein [Thiohalospira halophila DSM 15071]|uniref:AAA ATPase domain-containing protein n=1 Tax=Thiohalospira halophila DSM 15071 TaxID=1123397 RepID=A0A1I1V1P0_9GAMM|nr:AAA family ATPase [Thiohalospira halophila]SFD74993.1 AAA ATPase domain-containing protein [Thiohalospira halophila DSM 15071]
MSAALEVTLLGPPRLRPAVLGPGHPLALLALLLVDGEVTREGAATLLWPESRQPRSDLRQALHRLRHALPKAGVDPVLADRNRLQLHPEYSLASDVTTFLAAVRAGGEAEPATLRRGVEAYGGPLLDGFKSGPHGSFEEWLEARRTWFREQARLLHLRLAHRELAEGNREAAVRTAAAFISREPDDAVGRRQLDEVLHASDRSDAPGPEAASAGLQQRHLVVVCCDPCPPDTANEEALVAAITRLRQLCRSNLEAREGRVEAGPDGVLYGYFGLPPRASRATTDALTAATTLLAADGEAPPVRVGLHAGRALTAGSGHPDFLGSVVRRARLAAMAAPVGELRLTQAAETALPPGWPSHLTPETDPAGSLFTTTAPALSEARHTPLVGRRRERAQLLAAVRKLRYRRGDACLLRGEAGIGKSRLAAAVRARTAQWIGTATVGSEGPETDRPLEPFLQFVEQLAALHPEQPRTERRRRLEDALAKVEIAEAEGEVVLRLLLEPPRADDELPGEAHRALAALVLARAAVTPLMLVVEDIHVADTSSRRVLVELARHAPDHPLLLIATGRPESVPVAGLHPLDLAPLGAAEVEAIIAGTAPSPLDQASSQALARMSEGIPLFAEELARAGGPDGEGGSPPSLEQLATARLDAAGRAARTARLLALVGREATAGFLAWLDERSMDETTADLQWLEADDLVLRRPRREGVFYRIRHALLEQAFYHSLPPGEAARLHRRLARGVETDYPTEAEARPAWLADHHRRAGQPAAATRRYLDAARQAGRFGAHEAATSAREQARAAIAELPVGSEREALVHELEQLTALQGLVVAGHATTRSALEQLIPVDPEADFDAALARIIGGVHATPWEALLPRTEELVAIARARGETGRLHTARHLLGFIANYTGHLPLALEQFRALVDEGETTSAPETLLQAYNGPPRPVEIAYLALLELGQGRAERSRRLRDEALAAARAHGSSNLLAHALVLMAARARHDLAPEEALVLAEEAIRLSREEGLRTARLIAGACARWARSRLGWPAAVDRMDRALAAEGGNAATFARSTYLVAALGAQGRDGAAIGLARRLCRGPERPHVPTSAHPLVALQLGLSLESCGHPRPARRALHAGLEQARANRNPLQIARCAAALADLQAAAGETATAAITLRAAVAELPPEADAEAITALRQRAGQTAA